MIRATRRRGHERLQLGPNSRDNGERIASIFSPMISGNAFCFSDKPVAATISGTDLVQVACRPRYIYYQPIMRIRDKTMERQTIDRSSKAHQLPTLHNPQKFQLVFTPPAPRSTAAIVAARFLLISLLAALTVSALSH
jgi:hypothetical protein